MDEKLIFLKIKINTKGTVLKRLLVRFKIKLRGILFRQIGEKLIYHPMSSPCRSSILKSYSVFYLLVNAI